MQLLYSCLSIFWESFFLKTAATAYASHLCKIVTATHGILPKWSDWGSNSLSCCLVDVSDLFLLTLLKPEVLSLGPRWRIQWYVRVYQSRDETGSSCRPDLNSSTRCIIPYHYGSESSSLYTCNTSWCSVHYMILNKPLVRLTTVHYQSAVSMISFAQVLTVQWSDTISCWNVWFQVRITSHYILFQHSH